MPEQLIKELASKLDGQHQFLRDHAKNEENALETIDKTMSEILAETRTQTQNNIRLADIQQERWDHEKEERRARREAEQAEKKRQAELAEKRGAWFQTQWEKWSMPAFIILAAVLAPNAVPLIFQAMGIATPQQVQVVAAPEPNPVVVPVPVPVEAEAAEDGEP